jgi:RHS repeat-associated protein
MTAFAGCCFTTGSPTRSVADSETGNDYAFARYYNPRLGRFMSPDPLGGSMGDPQSLNLYAYVGNRPLGFIDPSGMALCDAHVWDYPGCVGGPGPSMTCYQDSVVTDCGQVLRNIDLGTAAQCPKNDCTGFKAGLGPGGTTVFQIWTPGGSVSYSGTSDSTYYPGYWTTIAFSNSNGPLTYEQMMGALTQAQKLAQGPMNALTVAAGAEAAVPLIVAAPEVFATAKAVGIAGVGTFLVYAGQITEGVGAFLDHAPAITSVSTAIGAGINMLRNAACSAKNDEPWYCF